MITRAQAEALLTLAESLEACERLEISISLPKDDIETTLIEGYDWGHFLLGGMTGMEIRTLIATLYPKSET